MDTVIAITMSLTVFGFFMVVVIRNLKKHVATNTHRTQPTQNTMTGHSSKSDKAGSVKDDMPQEEGKASVKELKTHTQPVTHVQATVNTEEETDDISELIPDFTDENELRRSIITAEIINRKYN